MRSMSPYHKFGNASALFRFGNALPNVGLICVCVCFALCVCVVVVCGCVCQQNKRTASTDGRAPLNFTYHSICIRGVRPDSTAVTKHPAGTHTHTHTHKRQQRTHIRGGQRSVSARARSRKCNDYVACQATDTRSSVLTNGLILICAQGLQRTAHR